MTEVQITSCKYCPKNEKHETLPCHFCHEPICQKHAHYLTIPYHSLHGSSNNTIRVCAACKPQTVLPKIRI